MAQHDRISSILANVLPSVTDAEISDVLAAFDTNRSDLEVEAPTLVKHPVCDEIKAVRAREAAKAKARSSAPVSAAPKVSDTIRPVTMDSIPDVSEVDEVTVAVQSSPELQAAPVPAAHASVRALKVETAKPAADKRPSVSTKAAQPIDAAKATPSADQIRAHMEKVRTARLGTSEVKRTKRSASWGLVAIAAALVLGVGTTGPGRTLAQHGKAWVGSLPLTTAFAHASVPAPAAAPVAAAMTTTTATTENVESTTAQANAPAAAESAAPAEKPAAAPKADAKRRGKGR